MARDPLGRRSRSGFDPLCGGLRASLHLRTLLLRGIGVDDGEAEGVASFLALSVRLEQLDLSENQVLPHRRWAPSGNATVPGTF